MSVIYTHASSLPDGNLHTGDRGVTRRPSRDFTDWPYCKEQSSKPSKGTAVLLPQQGPPETSLPWSAAVNLTNSRTRWREVVAGSLDVLQTVTKERSTKRTLQSEYLLLEQQLYEVHQECWNTNNSAYIQRSINKGVRKSLLMSIISQPAGVLLSPTINPLI